VQIRAAVQNLHLAPETAGPHPPAGRDLPQRCVPVGNEGVPAILPLRHRAQGAAGGHLRGHVLEAVHRQVNLPGQQGLLDLLDEQPLAPDLGQGHILEFVPGGLDDHQFGGQPGVEGLEAGLHPAGLGQGQGTAPGADAHSRRQSAP
jgi:hypothetical protein